jgi:hypothetical protein
MQNDQRRSKILITTIVLVAALVIFLVFITSRKSTHPNQATGKTTIYNDPVSHEQITTQEGKTAEQVTNDPNTPLFAGFGKLLEIGLSQQQLAAAQHAFAQYKPFASNDVQISLAVDNVEQVSPLTSGDSEERWSVKSFVVVNRKDKYQFTLYYEGASVAELILYNANQTTQLFDSGSIDANSFSSS